MTLLGGLGSTYFMVTGLTGGSWWIPSLAAWLATTGLAIIGWCETQSEGVFLGDCHGCSTRDHDLETQSERMALLERNYTTMCNNYCDAIVERKEKEAK
jgi:hypothetical protein